MSNFQRSPLRAAAFARALGWGMAAVVVSLSVSGCSSTPSRFQSGKGSYGLTGGTETMRATPPAPLHTSEPRAPSRPDDPYGNAVYRGGRDPVTGKAVGPASNAAPLPGAMPRADAAPRPAVPAAGRPRVAGRTVVEVQEGDTLYGLSTKYRVSMNSIMLANNIKDPALTPGQQLVIPAR